MLVEHEKSFITSGPGFFSVYSELSVSIFRIFIVSCLEACCVLYRAFLIKKEPQLCWLTMLVAPSSNPASGRIHHTIN